MDFQLSLVVVAVAVVACVVSLVLPLLLYYLCRNCRKHHRRPFHPFTTRYSYIRNSFRQASTYLFSTSPQEFSLSGMMLELTEPPRSSRQPLPPSPDPPRSTTFHRLPPPDSPPPLPPCSLQTFSPHPESRRQRPTYYHSIKQQASTTVMAGESGSEGNSMRSQKNRYTRKQQPSSSSRNNTNSHSGTGSQGTEGSVRPHHSPHRHPKPRTAKVSSKATRPRDEQYPHLDGQARVNREMVDALENRRTRIESAERSQPKTSRKNSHKYTKPPKAHQLSVGTAPPSPLPEPPGQPPTLWSPCCPIHAPYPNGCSHHRHSHTRHLVAGTVAAAEKSRKRKLLNRSRPKHVLVQM